MLDEGVPPAMIENAGRQAGMPVGPLSLNDEVALDLGLKIAKATEAQLGAGRRRPGAEGAARRDWSRTRAASAARTGRASTTTPRARPKRLWPGLEGPAAAPPRSRRRRLHRAEAAPPRGAGAGGGPHRGRGRGHRSARGRCRLDPRLRLRALHRRRPVLHRLHGRAGLRGRWPRALEAKHGPRFAVPRQPASPWPSAAARSTGARSGLPRRRR